MNVCYRIIEIYPETRIMVVRYYTDKILEVELMVNQEFKEDGSPVRCKTDVSLSIPIPELSELGMHKHILRAAPIAFLEMLEKQKAGVPEDLAIPNTEKMKNKHFMKSTEEIDTLLKMGKPETPEQKTLTEEDLKPILSEVNVTSPLTSNT